MRRQESGQLLLAFADSPQGNKEARTTDVSAGRAHLQQIAKARKAKETCTPEEAIGLLEEIASLPNLASALLQVSRNGGAPGVDGLTVKDFLKAAPRLLVRLRADLLSGRY